MSIRTILFATDFSESNKNSFDFAVGIAKLSKARLILFHVFQLPVSSFEVPVMNLPQDEFARHCEETLEKMKNSASLALSGQTRVDCICRAGFAADEINTVARQEKADLLIMGMHGAGYLSEKLMGSVTTTLIQKGKIPVLVIGERMKFAPFKKIVLACDYNNLSDKTDLTMLKELAILFHSKILVLNVIEEKELVEAYNESIGGIHSDFESDHIDHSFHTAEQNNIIEGINTFTEENEGDLIAMIPQQHNVLGTLFREGNTKKMAFHSHLPLLAIPSGDREE